MRVRTADDLVSDGTLDVGVDSGSGVTWISTGQLWARSSTVHDACYPTLVGVQIRNPTNNGWIGFFQYAIGGTTYLPLPCVSGCSTGCQDTMLAQLPALEAGCQRVFICRHGETTTNAEQKLQGGRLDASLNAKGCPKSDM